VSDDIVTTDEAAGSRGIESVDLQVEMQRSYMDYAMSVIVSNLQGTSVLIICLYLFYF
jgi:DNA gyrase subunit A